MLHRAFGVEYDPYTGFHEGFADVLAHLVYDTTLIAEDLIACGEPGRDPNEENVRYPSCFMDPKMTEPALAHYRGMLLSKIWLNILTNLRGVYGQTPGLAETQDLHRKWMPLAQPPGPDPVQCPTRDQSASVETLLEVLVADSPDDDPANAPHLEEICDAFELQDIFYPPLCGGDAAGQTCFADCDASRSLNVLDFICFHRRFTDGSPSADCDGNKQLDILDFACFQDEFVSGCH